MVMKWGPHYLYLGVGVSPLPPVFLGEALATGLGVLHGMEPELLVIQR